MTDETTRSTPIVDQLRNAFALLRRPYPVPPSMLLLFALIPLYVFGPVLLPPEVRYTPALQLDHAIPLVPAWTLVYAGLYLYLIVVPVLVVRDPARVRRTVHAYLFIWLTAYLFFFFLYPTVAHRPEEVVGEGFSAWSLRGLYGADPPYNCFPSLHVAHSFVSAFACREVHRRLGLIFLIFASLVGLSTLFIKQHYVLDVVAGVLLAWLAQRIFLAGKPGTASADEERAAAPAMALLTALVVSIPLIGAYIIYRLTQ